MTNKLIGLLEVCGSMAYKITGDAQPHSGMGKYESKDIFLSVKGSCMPSDYEEVAAELHAFVQNSVMAAATYHANITLMPAPQAPAEDVTVTSDQVEEKAPPPASSEVIGKYVVAEKAPEKTAPATAPAGPQAVTPKVLADRLKAAGMSTEELSQWALKYHQATDVSELNKAKYIEAFTAAEEFLKEHGIAGVRQALQQPPASSDTPSVQAEEGPVMVLMPHVAAKFPLWKPAMVRMGAMWCADQVKDAGALQAFLIAAGMGDQTPLARVEAYLAITRHLAMSAGATLLEYSKKSGNPLSMIEDEISKIVGQPIRFASGLAPDAVSNALNQLMGAKA